MIITHTIIDSTKRRATASDELVDVLHTQWQFQGNKEIINKKTEDDRRKTALPDINNNKEI